MSLNYSENINLKTSTELVPKHFKLKLNNKTSCLNIKSETDISLSHAEDCLGENIADITDNIRITIKDVDGNLKINDNDVCVTLRSDDGTVNGDVYATSRLGKCKVLDSKYIQTYRCMNLAGTTVDPFNKCTDELLAQGNFTSTSCTVYIKDETGMDIVGNSFAGNCPEEFTNFKSERKSRKIEHFESNKNLKCKHKY